jgi:GH18 family chitinase
MTLSARLPSRKAVPVQVGKFALGAALLGFFVANGCSSSNETDCVVDGTCTNDGSAGSGAAPAAGSAGTAGTFVGTGGSGPRAEAGATGGSGGGGGAGGAAFVDAARPFASRVVAYLPTWRGLSDWATGIDYAKITHLDIAFANPTSGNDPTLGAGSDAAVLDIVNGAHAKGVKVMISIGGASGGSERIAALLVPGSMLAFVQKLDAFIDAHNLDGLDVDIEGDPVDANYAPFIDAMSAKLKPKGKLLTAAYGTWFGDRIPDSSLRQLDFVNVMSYDHCGSWTKPCPHSPYNLAVADLDYFAQQRGVPVGKLVLGVPFYGYCWGTACASSALTYPEILAKYPNAWQTDWIDDTNVQISYNGDATIQSKAKLAKSYGGIMIWEVTEDAPGDRSLLNLIAGSL